jgi:hypothetical protein
MRSSHRRASAARSRRPAVRACRTRRSGAAVRCGKSASDWKTSATPRRSGGRSTPRRESKKRLLAQRDEARRSAARGRRRHQARALARAEGPKSTVIPAGASKRACSRGGRSGRLDAHATRRLAQGSPAMAPARRELDHRVEQRDASEVITAPCPAPRPRARPAPRRRWRASRSASAGDVPASMRVTPKSRGRARSPAPARGRRRPGQRQHDGRKVRAGPPERCARAPMKRSSTASMAARADFTIEGERPSVAASHGRPTAGRRWRAGESASRPPRARCGARAPRGRSRPSTVGGLHHRRGHEHVEQVAPGKRRRASARRPGRRPGPRGTSRARPPGKDSSSASHLTARSPPRRAGGTRACARSLPAGPGAEGGPRNSRPRRGAPTAPAGDDSPGPWARWSASSTGTCWPSFFRPPARNATSAAVGVAGLGELQGLADVLAVHQAALHGVPEPAARQGRPGPPCRRARVSGLARATWAKRGSARSARPRRRSPRLHRARRPRA